MSKLRDGVIKRGSTWSYVARVQDPETGRSRPKWVGGFASEEAAKAARDEARVAARRGTLCRPVGRDRPRLPDRVAGRPRGQREARHHRGLPG
jgi:hypothetical protein